MKNHLSAPVQRYPEVVLRPLGRRGAGWALVVGFLVTFYSYLPIEISGLHSLPAGIAACIGFILLIKNVTCIRARHCIAILVLFTAAGLSALFSIDSDLYIEPRLHGFLYFVYSVSAGYGLLLELLGWSRNALVRLFGVALAIVLVGVLLERYFGLKDLSDAFRSVAYSGRSLDQESRDLAISGIVRPKFFTAEPAHVAFFFVLCATMWLSLSRWQYRYVAATVTIVVAAYLIRSPIVLFAFPLMLVVRCILRCREYYPRRRTSVVLFFMMLALSVPIGIAGIIESYDDRAERIVKGNDESFKLRMIAPALLARDVLSVNPYFGAGISGTEAVEPLVVDVYKKAGVKIDPGRLTRPDNLLVNAFWQYWATFGIIGGVLIVFGVSVLIKSTGSGSMLYVGSAAIIFGQMIGTAHGFRVTVVTALLIVAAHKARELATPFKTVGRGSMLPQVRVSPSPSV